MQTLAASIDGLKAAVFGSIESLKAEIRIVKAEVGALNSDVISLKAAVGAVNSDVVSLKAAVGEVKQEAKRARDATDSLKYFVIGTGIALAALLAAMLAYGVQNFDTALSLIQTIVSVKPQQVPLIRSPATA